MTESNQLNDTNLIWIDLEMTGLNPEEDRIIEIATIVTDAHLNVIAEGPVMAVKQSDELLNGMDEWCTRTHGESGLTDRVRKSSITDAEAEQATIEFLKQYVPEGKSPLCGNSVWQDRRFLARYMPALEAYCHYRLIDVSTLKELAKRWNPKALEGFTKAGVHLALDDIRESIEELKHYRETFIDINKR